MFFSLAALPFWFLCTFRVCGLIFAAFLSIDILTKFYLIQMAIFVHSA